jgi:hypothetical protein
MIEDPIVEEILQRIGVLLGVLLKGSFSLHSEVDFCGRYALFFNNTV